MARTRTGPRYASQNDAAHAARTAIAQAEKAKERVRILERGIREHYKQCLAGNWGYDDIIWSLVGIEADPEVLG